MVQTSFLGDVILSTPVISGLKRIYPESELWAVTTPLASELLKRDPLLEGVLTFDKRGADAGIAGLFNFARQLRGMHFDAVFSLHKSARTALLLCLTGIKERIGFDQAKFNFLYNQRVGRSKQEHDVSRNLSILSGKLPLEELDSQLRLFAPAAEELSDVLKEKIRNLNRYVVLVPGSAWTTKMWYAEGYRQVAQHLISSGKKVLVLGSAEEKGLCDSVCQGLDVVNLAGLSTIGELMFLVQNASLLVCNDSMALHLASAFKIPTVVIFCATSPRFGFGPWQNKAIVIEKEGLACRPCARHGSRRCPTGTEACMRSISSQRVIAAIEELQR